MTSISLNEFGSMMSATRSTKDKEDQGEYKCPLLPKLKNTLRMMDDRT